MNLLARIGNITESKHTSTWIRAHESFVSRDILALQIFKQTFHLSGYNAKMPKYRFSFGCCSCFDLIFVNLHGHELFNDDRLDWVMRQGSGKY